MITREYLIDQIDKLEKQFTQAVAQVNGIDGALQIQRNNLLQFDKPMEDIKEKTLEIAKKK